MGIFDITKKSTEVKWEFPDVKYSSSQSAVSSSIASINTANRSH